MTVQSLTNQIEYTGLRQDSYLLLFESCFSRKGLALIKMSVSASVDTGTKSSYFDH